MSDERRRLEPLKLTEENRPAPAPLSPAADPRNVASPQPPAAPSAGGREARAPAGQPIHAPATPSGAQSASAGNRTLLIVLLVAGGATVLLFLVIVLAGAVAGFVLARSPARPAPAVTPPRATATELPVAPPTSAVPWTSLLHGPTCDAPCSGGSACATRPAPCPSSFTCVPGTDDDNLDERKWTLHLSAAFENIAGKPVSLCRKPGAAVEVCFRPTSTGAQTCVPLSDACSHRDHAVAGVPVSTADLTRDGIDIEIRGTVVAQKKKASYSGNIRRKALCSGLRFGGFTNYVGSNIEYITYFLEPAP